MGKHPANLVLRFLLELVTLFALAYWGWTQHTGWARVLLAVALPVTAAALWGIFRVPGDIGKVGVAVPGVLRLAGELVYFAAGTWALYAAGLRPLWLVFGLLVIGHYILSYDRVIWLIKR